jgi:hypothetical protein
MQADSVDSTSVASALAALLAKALTPRVIALPASPSNVVAFPPTHHDAATVAAAAGEWPSEHLLFTARRTLDFAYVERDNAAQRTANLNRVYMALLLCCRLLDEAAYPWEGAIAAPAGSAAQ